MLGKQINNWRVVKDPLLSLYLERKKMKLDLVNASDDFKRRNPSMFNIKQSDKVQTVNKSLVNLPNASDFQIEKKMSKSEQIVESFWIPDYDPLKVFFNKIRYEIESGNYTPDFVFYSKKDKMVHGVEVKGIIEGSKGKIKNRSAGESLLRYKQAVKEYQHICWHWLDVDVKTGEITEKILTKCGKLIAK